MASRLELGSLMSASPRGGLQSRVKHHPRTNDDKHPKIRIPVMPADLIIQTDSQGDVAYFLLRLWFRIMCIAVLLAVIFVCLRSRTLDETLDDLVGLTDEFLED